MPDLNATTEKEMTEQSTLAQAKEAIESVELSLLEQKAASGDGKACALLGRYYELGKGVPRSDESAVYYYQKGAEKGEKDALFALSNLLSEGRGIERNDTLSRDMLSRAAHLGHSEAQNEYARRLLERGHDSDARAYFEKALAGGELAAATSLGELYERGIGVVKDDEKAISYYEKASKDDLKAAFHLAVLKGDDACLRFCLEKEYPDALYYEGMRKQDPVLLEKALSHGVEEARLPLGRIYYERKNYERAAELLKRSHEGEAFYLLGNLYKKGVLPKSHKQAALYYETSSELGYAEGMYALAVCYDTGFGMIRNEETAMTFFAKAAALGQLDSVYELGRHKMNGLGTDRDEKEAAKQYLLAADLGHVRAAYCYGQCLKRGIGVRKDEKKAISYIEQAANRGFPKAQFEFGSFLLKTEPEKGASWFERAYEQGNKEAGIALADCYRFGKGKERDEEKAFSLYETLFSCLPAEKCRELSVWLKESSFAPKDKWLSYLARAAEEGDASAEYEYGVCYDQGKEFPHNLERTLYWLEKASKQGHLEAKERLANLLARKGQIAGLDEKKAFSLYRELLEKGVKRVGYPLGVCYQMGQGVEENAERAARCFALAAEANVLEARIALAECYLTGYGLPADRQKAYEQFRTAAFAGDATSAYRAYLLKPTETDLYRMAVEAEIPDALCKEGLSQDDPKKSTEYLARAAALGSARGMYSYAERLLLGKGAEKDEAEGVRWLKKAFASSYEPAGFLLASCYSEGTGVECDHTKACEYRELLAFRGNAEAMLLSAEHYRYGIGVKVNYARAYDWYLKAAERGIGKAQYCVALCYLDGMGTKQNPALAASWMKKAFSTLYEDTTFDTVIQKGLEEGDGASLLAIGNRYFEGKGVPIDKAKAEYWYRRSANTGYAEGYYRRGRMFSFGTGVALDEQEAFWCYKKGAELGSLDALYETAVSYYDGRGVEQDFKEAKRRFARFNEANSKLLQKKIERKYKITESFAHLFESAVDGNAESQYVIASRFRTAFGIAKNEERAIYWLKKAQKGGNEDAECFLRKMGAWKSDEQEEANADVE
ncbi:MAG: sel1 repeat family protein [Clostridia bacterium]|nr:sel1 repeat family protein [Clostridia bacterium]